MLPTRVSTLSQSFPRPGGSQRLPEGWIQRLLLGGWLRSYLIVLVVACLATELSAHVYATAVGAPPVLLFVGLSVLGVLPQRWDWCFTLLWLAGCWTGSVVFLIWYH